MTQQKDLNQADGGDAALELALAAGAKYSEAARGAPLSTGGFLRGFAAICSQFVHAFVVDRS